MVRTATDDSDRGEVAREDLGDNDMKLLGDGEGVAEGVIIPASKQWKDEQS